MFHHPKYSSAANLLSRFLVVVGCALACQHFTTLVNAAEPGAEPAIVPWPQKLTLGAGRLTLANQTRIVTQDKQLLPLAEVLSSEILRAYGVRLDVKQEPAKAGDVSLALNSQQKKEHYQLEIADKATITGGDYNAVAMGTVTLLQAIVAADGKLTLPKMTVNDHPHFEYCGVMLDVARLPHSIDTLKQCVEVCRLYKIRYLHLHMTDENAWLFPSTAFPQLGAKNGGALGGQPPTRYTLEELKQLVAYGDARGVTFVPEIEVPGHSGQLVGSLPEIFGVKDADGKPLGIGMINLASERAYEALDTLIGELCDVFKSSPYIHTGGDEVSMANLDLSPEVKAFAAKHKLANLYQVQNPFQARLRDIIVKHGKQMMAWDGAHSPNPLPKDIIFMPWQAGTTEAASLVSQGYRVVNAPWGVDNPYFNPFQSNGALLKRDEPNLIGATAILWEAPQEKAVPNLRYIASLRNEPTYNPNSGRDHADFIRRLAKTDVLLDKLLYGYSFQGEGLLDPTTFMQITAAFVDRTKVSLVSGAPDIQVRYTLDGAEPTPQSPEYTKPFVVDQSKTLKAQQFDAAGTRLGPLYVKELRKTPHVQHDAIGAKITIKPEAAGSYKGAGAPALVDGYLADGDQHSSSGWVGWGASEIEVSIDLGKSTPVQGLSGHFLRARFGLALPKSVEFSISEDGQSYKTIGTVDEVKGGRQRGWYAVNAGGAAARFVRVKIASGGSWTFIDEIMVNGAPPAPSVKHAALGKPVTISPEEREPGYFACGPEAITDGYVSRSADCLNIEYLGIQTKPFVVTVDLGAETAIQRVEVYASQLITLGVYIPARVDVLVSDDGQMFREVAKITPPADTRVEFKSVLGADLTDVRGRYVRFACYQRGHWIFLDEVVVNPQN